MAKVDTGNAADKKTKTAKPAVPENSGWLSRKKEIAIVLVFTAVVTCILLVMNAGTYAKANVERLASAALGVNVAMDQLDISLQDKQINITGLHIGNPEGYSAADAMSVDRIFIQAETISKELLVFDEIRVTGNMLNLEVGKAGTNFTTIRHHAAARAGQQSKAGDNPAKVIIRELVIESAKLHPRTTMTGIELQTVNLPNVNITGIGEAENGVIPSEAMAQIAEYVIRVAVKNSAEAGFLRGMNEASLEQIHQEFGLTLSSSFKEQVKDLGDKVKSIFGN